jgi:hypothetical protein
MWRYWGISCKNCQDDRSLRRDLNHEPPEYESEARHSLLWDVTQRILELPTFRDNYWSILQGSSPRKISSWHWKKKPIVVPKRRQFTTNLRCVNPRRGKPEITWNGTDKHSPALFGLYYCLARLFTYVWLRTWSHLTCLYVLQNWLGRELVSTCMSYRSVSAAQMFCG